MGEEPHVLPPTQPWITEEPRPDTFHLPALEQEVLVTPPKEMLPQKEVILAKMITFPSHNLHLCLLQRNIKA